MQFIDPFKQFNTVDSKLDDPFPLIVFDIVKRARKFIKGRTLDEINYVFYTINYLLYKAECGAGLEDNNNVNVPKYLLRNTKVLPKCLN